MFLGKLEKLRIKTKKMKTIFYFTNLSIKEIELDLQIFLKKKSIITFDNLFDEYGDLVYCDFKVKKINHKINLENGIHFSSVELKAINL